MSFEPAAIRQGVRPGPGDRRCRSGGSSFDSSLRVRIGRTRRMAMLLERNVVGYRTAGLILFDFVRAIAVLLSVGYALGR